jgi:hypothetical protein
MINFQYCSDTGPFQELHACPVIRIVHLGHVDTTSIVCRPVGALTASLQLATRAEKQAKMGKKRQILINYRRLFFLARRSPAMARAIWLGPRDTNDDC